MPEYLYTVDLGPEWGARFERLAQATPFDDREAFAAWLLRGAIENLERDQAEQSQGQGAKPSVIGGVIDDGIPF